MSEETKPVVLVGRVRFGGGAAAGIPLKDGVQGEIRFVGQEGQQLKTPTKFRVEVITPLAVEAPQSLITEDMRQTAKIEAAYLRLNHPGDRPQQHFPPIPYRSEYEGGPETITDIGEAALEYQEEVVRQWSEMADWSRGRLEALIDAEG